MSINMHKNVNVTIVTIMNNMFKLCALVCVCVTNDDTTCCWYIELHTIQAHLAKRQQETNEKWSLFCGAKKKFPVTKYGYAQLPLECRDGSETFGSDIYFGTHFHFDFWHPGHRIHRKLFIRCSDPDSQSIGRGHISQIESPAARESRYCHHSSEWQNMQKKKAPTGKNPSWASKSVSSSRATNFWGRGISSKLGCWEHSSRAFTSMPNQI